MFLILANFNLFEFSAAILQKGLFSGNQIIKQEGVYVSIDTWNLDGSGTNGKRL